MNHPAPSCESFAEAVSLVAAGCLSADEEAPVRQHLASCPACGERFEQLAALCGSLAAARPDVGTAGADVVARVMDEIGTVAVASSHRSSAAGSRRYGWQLAGAALAASLLVAVLWRSFFPGVAPEPEVARPGIAGTESQRKETSREIAPTPVAAASPLPAPTWLALRRAAARSDEEFEALLAGGNGSVIIGTFDNPKLRQEFYR